MLTWKSDRWWVSATLTPPLLVVLWIVKSLLSPDPAGALSGGIRETTGAATPAQAAVGSQISYQGYLQENGQPVNGARDLTFRFFTDSACTSPAGTAIARTGVPIANGLFSVELDVEPATFNGQELWLEVRVGSSPIGCQKITVTPYAFSLRPGARVAGPPTESTGAVISASLPSGFPNGSAISGVNPATGTAGLFSSAGGYGVFGYSDGAVGVAGHSAGSWGGYFTSQQGYGIRVESEGTDHWDHAGYFSANNGYAIYATSNSNMAIRGEAGDVSGISQPLGAVGVAGLGENRGAYGASNNGVGVYGSSQSNYGVWGNSDSWRGVTGRTSRPDNNYGIYTPDNLFAANYTSSGAMMQVAQNTGTEPIEPGDVVVFSGINQPLGVTGPTVVQVSRATSATATGVAGVVSSRFNLDSVTEDQGNRSTLAQDMEITPAGPVPPGGYLLLITHGPAQVKVESVSGAIQPGSLLSAGGNEGRVTLATEVSVAGTSLAPPGTVLGKALQPAQPGDERIWIFVTLR